MRNSLKNIFGKFLDSFSLFRDERNFLTDFSYLFSSKFLIVLLGIAVSPILTRLYTPDAYGYFALFNAIAINFAVISCLSYDQVLIIVKEEKQFYTLFIGCLLLIAGFAIVFFGGLSALLWTGVEVDLKIGDLSSFKVICLLSTGGIIYSITQLIPKWNIRRRYFKYAGAVSVVNQSVNRGTALLLGWSKILPSLGLITGELLGKLIAIVLNFRKTLLPEWKKFSRGISMKELRPILLGNLNYPKYYLTSGYLGILTEQIPIFAFSAYYNASVLGGYALAVSMVQLPVQLMNKTLNPLLLKHLSDYKNIEEVSGFLNKIILLMVLGLVPFVCLLIFFSDIIFPFVFGEGWELAGAFCSILSVQIIMLALKTLSTPLFQIYKKERNLLWFSSARVLSISLLSIPPAIILDNFFLIPIGFTASMYIFSWWELKKALKIVRMNIDKLLTLVTIVFVICYMLKYL